MIYTPEEKERMDRLLEAFGDYVASSRDMEYDAVHRKLRAYVCRLDADRDYALQKLDRFIARYRAQLTLP